MECIFRHAQFLDVGPFRMSSLGRTLDLAGPRFNAIPKSAGTASIERRDFIVLRKSNGQRYMIHCPR